MTFEEQLLRLVISNSTEKLTQLLEAYKIAKEAFEITGFEHAFSFNINFISEYSDGYPGIHKTYGKTALHVALEKRFGAIVQLLLEAECDVNKPDISGFFPLHTAIKTDDPEMVQLLINAKANISCSAELILSFADIIAKASNNRCEILGVLLTAGYDVDAKPNNGAFNQNLLIVAAGARDFAMVQRILEAGAKVHLLDEGKSSALYKISAQMHKPNQAQAYYATNIKIINELLNYGAGIYGQSLDFTSSNSKAITANKVVIGLEIFVSVPYDKIIKVTRKTPGFEKAITSLKELKEFMQTPEAYSAKSLTHLRRVLNACEAMMKDSDVKEKDKENLKAIVQELQVVKYQVMPDDSKVTSLKGICLNSLNGISTDSTFNRAGFFAERRKAFEMKAVSMSDVSKLTDHEKVLASNQIPEDLLILLAPIPDLNNNQLVK